MLSDVEVALVELDRSAFVRDGVLKLETTAFDRFHRAARKVLHFFPKTVSRRQYVDLRLPCGNSRGPACEKTECLFSYPCYTARQPEHFPGQVRGKIPLFTTQRILRGQPLCRFLRKKRRRFFDRKFLCRKKNVDFPLDKMSGLPICFSKVCRITQYRRKTPESEVTMAKKNRTKKDEEDFIKGLYGFCRWSVDNEKDRSFMSTNIIHDLGEWYRNREEDWFSPRTASYAKYIDV